MGPAERGMPGFGSGRVDGGSNPYGEAGPARSEANLIELRTAHSADLDPSTRSAIRGLLDAAFGGISDDTFENVLGGMHAMVVEQGELVGHGSIV